MSCERALIPVACSSAQRACKLQQPVQRPGLQAYSWLLRNVGKLVKRLKPPRAKGVLRWHDEPWTTCIQWLPQQQGSGQCFVCGTGHHKLRVYDARAQQRPVAEVAWRDARITALAVEHSGTRVWAANAKGCMQVCVLQCRMSCAKHA